MPSSMSEFERLFLLEFFVDSIYIKNSSVENVNDSTLCVSFQFLYYPVMLVCEEDFTPNTKPLTKGTNVVFKSGKSCLFSLRTDQSNSMPADFVVNVKIIQNMKKCNPPQKALIGESVIKLGSSFTNLMKNSYKSELPSACVKQDTFPLCDKTGQQVGNLAAFVRLSCFGKLIVTQFQLGGEESKSYMFKGTDPKNIFTEGTNVIGPTSSLTGLEDEGGEEEIPGDTPYKDIFGFPKESEESTEPEESETTDGGGDEEGLEEKKVIHKQETKDEHEKQEFDKGEKEEDYKEIGAEINGNSIIIRVLKKAKRAKKHSVKSIEEVPQVPPSVHPTECPPCLCTCQCMPPMPKTCAQGCPPTCCPLPVCPPCPPDCICPPACAPSQPPNCCPPPGCPPSCCSPPSSSPSCPPNCCPPPGCPPSCCSPPPSCSPSCPPNCCPPPGCPPSCCPPSAGSLPTCPPKCCPPCPPCPTMCCPPPGGPSRYSQQTQGTFPPNMLQCTKEDCPLGLYNLNPQQNIVDLEPGTVAMKGDQVFFQMANRPAGEAVSEKERKLANSVYYKVGSTEAGKECMKNTVQISPQNPGEPLGCSGGVGGPVSGLPIDNKQDMFLLKVQQNCDGVDAKSKLEMELRTPKTKEPKPDTDSKNTQYITTDFPAPEKKTAAEKGKKKKK